MGTALRILIVEDSVDDAELLLWELRRGGYEPVWERVETAEAMMAALENREWDIVIADYVMPKFTGLAALELLQSEGLDLPFIIVSGKVGEDAAVEAMRAGAHDYLVKGHMARLVPAVKRELSEYRIRLERKQAEAELYLLKKAIETMPIGVTITDIKGIIIYTNPAEAVMHGYSVEELTGRDARILAPPDTWKKGPPRLKAMKGLIRESVNIRKDGSAFPVYLISNVVRDVGGEPIAIISTCEDITERKRFEETLRKQLAAMESSMDGMAILDKKGNYVYVNHAHAEIFGYDSPDELVGKNWRVLYEEGESRKIEHEIMSLLRLEGKWRGEAVGKRRDGTTFPQEISLTVIEEGGIICVVRDITERKATEEKLMYMSTHDPLTGFYNRAYFEEEMDRLERSRLFPVSIVMADLDGLKEINDTHGHAAGDKLLQEAAKVLYSVFRAEDMVARIGGDEFVVLLPEAGAAVVENALKRIRETLEDASRSLEGIPLSLSLGTATAEDSGKLLEAMKLADERMYQDKLSRNGRISGKMAGLDGDVKEEALRLGSTGK
ncbi:MAG: response regulator [Geobacteraceae bacterium]|nr:MAG: response regulator [Geobacteraceae bacterium]